MCRPSVLLFLCLLTFKTGIMAWGSGFRNRAIKHSLATRQFILGYRGSTKMHKTIGTPPRTLRQPWVSVLLQPMATPGLSITDIQRSLWVRNLRWAEQIAFGKSGSGESRRYEVSECSAGIIRCQSAVRALSPLRQNSWVTTAVLGSRPTKAFKLNDFCCS